MPLPMISPSKLPEMLLSRRKLFEAIAANVAKRKIQNSIQATGDRMSVTPQQFGMQLGQQAKQANLGNALRGLGIQAGRAGLRLGNAAKPLVDEATSMANTGAQRLGQTMFGNPVRAAVSGAGLATAGLAYGDHLAAKNQAMSQLKDVNNDVQKFKLNGVGSGMKMPQMPSNGVMPRSTGQGGLTGGGGPLSMSLAGKQAGIVPSVWDATSKSLQQRASLLQDMFANLRPLAGRKGLNAVGAAFKPEKYNGNWGRGLTTQHLSKMTDDASQQLGSVSDKLENLQDLFPLKKASLLSALSGGLGAGVGGLAGGMGGGMMGALTGGALGGAPGAGIGLLSGGALGMGAGAHLGGNIGASIGKKKKKDDEPKKEESAEKEEKSDEGEEEVKKSAAAVLTLLQKNNPEQFKAAAGPGTAEFGTKVTPTGSRRAGPIVTQPKPIRMPVGPAPAARPAAAPAADPRRQYTPFDWNKYPHDQQKNFERDVTRRMYTQYGVPEHAMRIPKSAPDLWQNVPQDQRKMMERDVQERLYGQYGGVEAFNNSMSDWAQREATPPAQ